MFILFIFSSADYVPAKTTYSTQSDDSAYEEVIKPYWQRNVLAS